MTPRSGFLRARPARRSPRTARPLPRKKRWSRELGKEIFFPEVFRGKIFFYLEISFFFLLKKASHFSLSPLSSLHSLSSPSTLSPRSARSPFYLAGVMDPSVSYEQMIAYQAGVEHSRSFEAFKRSRDEPSASLGGMEGARDAGKGSVYRITLHSVGVGGCNVPALL